MGFLILKSLTFHYPLATLIPTILEPISLMYFPFCVLLLEDSKEDLGERFSYLFLSYWPLPFHLCALVSFEMKPLLQVDSPRGFQDEPASQLETE